MKASGESSVAKATNFDFLHMGGTSILIKLELAGGG
jgi:hypothetical protein